MQKKGEVAFSTIVVVIIAAAVLIMVLIWVLPQYSDLFRKTEDVGEAAGVTDAEINKLECERFCIDAQGLDEADVSDSDFCTDELICKEKVSCGGVDCG